MSLLHDDTSADPAILDDWGREAGMHAAAGSAPLLRLREISISFGQRRVLESVSLDLAPAEILTLVGPNGAGKSTLVKIALGLLTPDGGQIARAADLRIGYVPQRLQLADTLPLTVARFVTLGTRAARAQVFAALGETGATHVIDSPIQAISGGELQRVLLARALLRRPQLLVLDEPVQGVDIAGQYALYDLIRQLRDRRGCAVLMVSHDLHLVMASTDRVLCLNRHVCCQGQPEHVSRDPRYLALFGRDGASHLAVYHHHHNHVHDLHGDVHPTTTERDA